MKIIEVVAAVILNSSNSVLIARRGPQKVLAGKWEFPGGKVEEGESHEHALERELLEEFSIETKTRSFISSNTHEYSQCIIKLNAYISEYIAGEFKLHDHDQIQWIAITHLRDYDLAAADLPIVSYLEKNFNTNHI